MTSTADHFYFGFRWPQLQNFLTWVVIWRNRHDFVRHLYQLWFRNRLLVTWPKFPVSAWSPCIEFIVFCQSKRMKSTSWNFCNKLSWELLYNLRQLSVVGMPVATLTFIVGLATTTPSVQSSVISQRNWMEITTVNLDDHRMSVRKGFNQSGLMFHLFTFFGNFSSFLVQSATPGINLAILSQT